jgi:hypothetical protein
MLLPHRLQLDGDVALDGLWKVEVLDAWKAFAAGITGFGEELLRTLRIELGTGRRLVVLTGTGRREAEGVAFAELGDFFGDALAINRQREGETDLRIGRTGAR